MEKNTKTILLAIFILLIAIVSFNFTGITGKAVSSVLEVSPKTVHRGGVIRVEVNPTKDGIDNRYMYIHRMNGARIEGSKIWVCGRYGSVCYKSSEVVYNTLGTYDKIKWPLGTYIIRVKNHKTGKNIETTFRLME